MDVYVCADMEGVASVVTREQLFPAGFEYERARRWMTDEVAAAIRGARSAGAQRIIVSDSHGNGQNLLLEYLPPETEVVRSWPRPLDMMQGIQDGSFGAALLIGHHAGATDFAGGLPLHDLRALPQSQKPWRLRTQMSALPSFARSSHA
jgi:D-amino peptidase